MGLPIYFNQRLSENNSLSQQFGYNTSLNYLGDTLAVGTLGSGVYIYQSGEIAQNFSGWVWKQKLTGQTNQGFIGDSFGYSIKLNGIGDVLTVSNPSEINTGNNAVGAIYIYSKNNNNLWSLSKKLTGFSGVDQTFGGSLDINYIGDIISVGSPYLTKTGLTYIFQSGVSDWKLERTITGNNYSFGESVSLNKSGDIIAIGSPYENQLSGKVYTLNWQLPNQIKLKNWELDESSVDISGIYTYQNNINPPGGIATGYKHNSLNSWIYFIESIYNRWELETDSDPNQWYNSSPNSGNRYILPLTGWRISNAQGTADALTTGTIDYILKEITGDNRVSNFGIDLDLNNSGDKLLIGSLNSDSASGAAYLFTGNNINWDLSKKFTGDGGIAQEFGSKVSLNGLGDVALISENKDLNTNGAAAGAAYLFTDNGSWSLNKKITGDSDTDYGDNFGFSITLNNSGNIAAIGAIGDGIDYKGAAYIFSDSDIKYSNFYGELNLIFGTEPADLVCNIGNSNNFLINLKGEENFSSP